MDKTTNRIKKIMLLSGDIAILYLALWLTLAVRYGALPKKEIWQIHLLPFSIIYLIWILVFYIIGLYGLDLARNNLAFFNTLFQAFVINSFIAITFFYLIPYFNIAPKTNLFLDSMISIILVFAWRQAYNHLIKSTTFLSNVLIIGKTKEAEEIAEKIKKNPQFGYRIKKIVNYENIKLIFDLTDIITKKNIQTVVTAVNLHKHPDLMQNLYHCLPLKITLVDLPSFYEGITGKVPISAIEEIWFLENLMSKRKNFFEIIKRVLDITFSVVFGLISLIFYPFVILVIKLDAPGPIFYKQKRVGQDGRIFSITKFRTMVQDAEKDGIQWAKNNDTRVTRVGRFLRKVRLDELPQLWNIIKGEMSFIGPRPERPEFVFGKNSIEREIHFYQIRHMVKPGLTGWAQIKFQYGASLEDTIEKLQYDLYYLKNRSFILDLSIMLKTIKIIFSAAGW